MDIVHIWKNIGETPLQAMERARKEFNIYDKGCYTGRLDPMAEGIMTLLFGDKIREAETYNSASKTYRFQAILGISTSSYDPLGRITNKRDVQYEEALKFLSHIISLKGDIEQIVPPYCAYKHMGQPLWRHAMLGTLPEELPKKLVNIKSVTSLQRYPTTISGSQYKCEVLNDLRCVKGFNADMNAIVKDWNEMEINSLYRICLEADVGSGTFIRSLVVDTASGLNIPAHVFRITRKKVSLI